MYQSQYSILNIHFRKSQAQAQKILAATWIPTAYWSSSTSYFVAIVTQDTQI